MAKKITFRDAPVRDTEHSERDHGNAPAAWMIDWTDPDKIDERDLVDFITTQYEEGKNRRAQWEASASEQLAWARGNQMLRWDDDAKDLMVFQEEGLPLEFRDPITINLLKGYVLQLLSFIIGRSLTFQVDPTTRDDDDVASARIASKVADYYWRGGTEDGLSRLLEAAWMMFCTGIVWCKPIWDPARGAVDSFTPDLLAQEEGFNPESEEQRQSLIERFKGYVATKRGFGVGQYEMDEHGTLNLPRGDIYIDWANGFDVTEPYNCRKAEEAPWLIHSRYRQMEYMIERYGEKAMSDIRPTSEAEAYQYRTNEQYGAYSSDRSGQLMAEEILVHELWRPRSISAPHGILAIVCDNKLIKVGRHPYLHGRLPFITFRELPDPEHFRPGCTIRDLMPLQRARNATRSFMLGHFRKTVDPRIFNEADSGLPDDAFLDGPKVIPLKDGGIEKVKAFEHPVLPSYTAGMDQLNQEDMENVGGIHSSTRGKAESAQQSGKHAEILRRGDQQRSTVTRILFEKSASRVGAQLLSLVWEFVPHETTATITGEHGKYEIFTFKSDDIRQKQFTGPMEWNITAHLGPETDIDMVLGKIEVLQAGGWISAEREKDRLMVKRWMGEHTAGDTDDDGYHRCNANNENHDLKEGQEVNIALGDDDIVHIDAHEHFTTLPEFREAAKKKPQMAMAMLMHIRAHQYAYAEKQLRLQAIAEQVKQDLMQQFQIMPPGQQGTGNAAPPPGGAPAGPPPHGQSASGVPAKAGV